MMEMINVGQQTGANMMHMLVVLDLDDPNEWEKLMKDTLEQDDNEA